MHPQPRNVLKSLNAMEDLNVACAGLEIATGVLALNTVSAIIKGLQHT
jgi:hypothetical protein